MSRKHATPGIENALTMRAGAVVRMWMAGDVERERDLLAFTDILQNAKESGRGV